MKRNIAFRLFALMMILLATACGSDPASPTPEPPTPPDPPTPVEPPFAIEVSDLSAVMATVSVTPLDQNAGYYADVLTEHNFLIAQEEGFERYLTWFVSSLMESTGKSHADVVKMITSYGNDSFLLTSLTPSSKYYAVAVGINSEGDPITEVVSEPFETPAVEQSANDFTITATELTTTGFTISVESTNDDPYVLAVYPLAESSVYTDEELAEYTIQSNMAWGGLEEMIHTGSFSFSESGKPGWEYEVVAFGYSLGAATTAVTREVIQLPEGGDPAACGFDVQVSFDDFKMYFEITPTDDTVVYVADVIEESYFQDMVEYCGSAEEGLKTNLESLIEYYMPDLDDNRGRVVEMITICGPVHFDMRYTYETNYRVWIVAVDPEGHPAAPFLYETTFTSPAQNISTASLSVKDYVYFNGTQLYESNPERYAGAKGFAVMNITVEPSADAATWRFYVAPEDVSDRAREVLIKNLELAPTTSDLLNQEIVCYWGTNTIFGAAKDAQGVYGPVMTQVVNLTKEGAMEIGGDWSGTIQRVPATTLFRTSPLRPETKPGFLRDRL